MISYQDACLILREQKLKLESQVGRLFDSCGKVLVDDVIVSRDLPVFSNSAMDGYAVSEIAQDYLLGGKIFAGQEESPNIPPHHCIKIMTGAMIPSNTIAVIPLEHAKIQEGKMIPLLPIKQDQHIRFCGEDYKRGDLLLSAGSRLDFASLSLLASQGMNEICTYRSLKIAIFSSGDELREPWQRAQKFQIYNTNAIAYHAILQDHGFSSDYLGILPDRKDELLEAIERFGQYDIVFTSGGVSVGEADLFQEVLKESGAEILFHGVNLKPGHPLLAGRLGDTLIFSLPGNPLSGALNLMILIIPILHKLAKDQTPRSSWIKAKIRGDLELKGKRSHMVLGTFDGEFFTPFKRGKYGTGSLLPLQNSNAVAMFDEGVTEILDGESVLITLYRSRH